MLIIPIPKPLQVNGGAQFRRVMAEARAVWAVSDASV